MVESQRTKLAKAVLKVLWGAGQYQYWHEKNVLPKLPSSLQADCKKDLAQLNMKEEVFPFGGYVRDLIAQEPFKDLDIWCNRSWLMVPSQIIRYLRDNGFTVEELKSETTYGNNEPGSCKSIQRQKLSVSFPGSYGKESIEVDLCTSNHSKTPFIHQDADVNSFTMHGEDDIRYNEFYDEENAKGSFVSTQYSATSPEYVAASNNIANRRFKVLNPNTTSQYRIEKLRYKGYKEYKISFQSTSKSKAKPVDEEKVRTIEEGRSLPLKEKTGCFIDNGDKFWYKEGKLHREDGPAVEYSNGQKRYWLEDTLYSEKKYKAIMLNRRDTKHSEVKPVTVKKEENQMSNSNTFMDMIKSDAEKAAYRVAATQMSNGVKKGLVKILESKGLEGPKAEAAAEMLNTEIGGAMVALLLGFGLKYAPMISEDPRAVKLSEEFRVKGMETVGNEVIGSLMEHLLPEVMNVLASLPEAKEKVRVNGEVPASAAVEVEEEDEVKVRGKKLSAVK